MTPLTKILLIDDDAVDRERVHRLLSPDYELHDAITGAEAIESLKTLRVDCVLLDYNLPDLDGLKLLSYLVSENLPIIMLTGQGNEEAAVDAMKRGARDYLPKKTLDYNVLIRSIRHSIREHKLEKDIEERDRKLRLHSQALEQSNDELSRFAYVVSHDLQEPLRTISSFVDLLLDRHEGQFDEQSKEWAHLIQDGAERMRSLISDLLKYSQIENKSCPFQSIDTNLLLKEVLANLDSSITESKAHIHYNELPNIWGDPRQINQLFQNLIGNAIKFSRKTDPIIEISVEEQGEIWCFMIKDNGIGIEEKFKDSIFEIFRRLNYRHEHPGNGIGLSLCYLIVEKHKGKIWVESKLGEGSTFYFTLPKMPEQDSTR